MNAVADEMEPRLAEAFIAAVTALQKSIDVQKLITAVASGDEKLIGDLLSEMPFYLQPVDAIVRQTLVRAAEEFGPLTTAKLGADIAFNIIDPRVVEWMRENSVSMVTNITEETVAALRSVLEQAAEEGLATVEIAEELRGMIGLNERQANALFHYREGLREQGLAEDTIAQLVDNYESNLLADRAEMISRTEVVHAANESQQQMWAEAVDDGLIDPEQTGQVWITTAGACEVCQALEGEVVPLDGYWVTIDGEQIDQPPAHPHCRCTIGLENF